jgi:hypothetical protein
MGLRARLGGSVALEEGGESAVDDLLDFAITTVKAADDSLPADLIPDTQIWTNPFSFPVKVMGGRYAPVTGNITGNDTNSATINIKTDDGAPAGPAPATVLSMTFPAAGGVLQNDSKAFGTWTAANSVVPPGGGVFLNSTKIGTGLVLRAGIITLRMRKIG